MAAKNNILDICGRFSNIIYKPTYSPPIEIRTLNAKKSFLNLNFFFQVDSILNRIHVAEPQARDTKVRAPFIPSTVHEKRMKKLAAKAERNQVKYWHLKQGTKKLET